MKKIAIGILATLALGVQAASVNNLTVRGNFKVKANAGAGKILTSDEDGIGTWQTPVEDEEPSPFTVEGQTISYTGTLYSLGAGIATEGLRLSVNSSPASGSTCTDGTVVRDLNYIYVCSGSTFKRAALSAY